MKFKALFVIFNIVLILSFLTIFLLPLFLLDGAFMLEFWRKNWYFGGIFLVVLTFVNALFLSQWKMLSYLEREDWPALARHLEGRIIGKKYFSRRTVRLYCDSLILLSDFPGIKRLSATLETGKPALFSLFSPRFAAASVLSGDLEGAYRIATAPCRDAGWESREWRAFYAGFARHLGSRPEDAAGILLPLARAARDPLIALLSGFLCGMVLAKSLAGLSDELSAAAAEAKSRVGSAFPRNRWNQYVEEAKADMQVVILGKLIGEATAWLYA